MNLPHPGAKLFSGPTQHWNSDGSIWLRLCANKEKRKSAKLKRKMKNERLNNLCHFHCKSGPKERARRSCCKQKTILIFKEKKTD